jgi:hypothetical protein
MITTSAVPENWQLLAKGIDPTTGELVAHVGRRSFLGKSESVCIWRVVKRGENWYNVGQWITGLNGYRLSPEKNGRKLSCSQQHLAIISAAEG